MVPLMSLLFIAASMAVVAVNHSRISGVMSTVFIEAFRPGAITGGICGVTTAQCIQWGLRRSAFSNEAGLGTAAIAHAAADTDDPAAHGMWGIFEVFADTIVICTCTALCGSFAAASISHGAASPGRRCISPPSRPCSARVLRRYSWPSPSAFSPTRA